MLEKEFYISTLITAELNRSLDLAGDEELQAWKKSSPEHLEFYNRLIAEEYFLQEFQHFNQIETDHIWQLTSSGLTGDLTAEAPQTAVRFIKIWPRVAGLVAAVAAFAICIYFFSEIRSRNAVGTEYAKGHPYIKPGINGATITLSSGKVIKLSEHQSGVLIGDHLAYTDGSSVTEDGISTQKEETLTATTTKGQTYTFTLPDGTKVWLNADSKISFAQRFSKQTRRVFLDGEAYFEVAKDKLHPFIVDSKQQQIEVLGTHFNVNSYIDEPEVTTTLLEGSVKIKVGNEQKIIKPGQQALNKSGVISVQETNVASVLDWKNGDFYLNHVAFKAAMRKIARWYDMEVIYDASVPDNMELGGWVSRNNQLATVLRSIESAVPVIFKVEGRRIYVVRQLNN
ncbi:FecR family protein [Pedobacter sp. BAL39]|uniref:FecR family protein n=1 Tax=Pedobacter sp. BAL39 TaxID=391596 RepID=UPI0018DB408A|nr:FecR domain-containing protein [Pedobacter sp. BAL39]